ncbi:MAG: MBL fold metallo-hydrolase [Spirochaetia bacterium]|nr:MBL fold metallo-hydrolase [Spirochaetia bacterium]
MKITVLGSGTSSGVPVLGKNSGVNLSLDPKDKRLRSSIYMEGDPPLLIDTGPDFRMQMLAQGINNITHVLLTHSHYDHVGGLDDLRPLCFKNPEGISCYSDEHTHREIIDRFQYFYDTKDYFGKPKLNFLYLPLDKSGNFSEFHIGTNRIQPVKLMHIESRSFYSVGYVFNGKFAYLTDFRWVDPAYIGFVQDLEILMVGAPLPDPHPNHLSIYEAIELIQKLNAQKGYITHLADAKFHQELADEFPENIIPAFDGLMINF